jgi:hypothetical protein
MLNFRLILGVNEAASCALRAFLKQISVVRGLGTRRTRYEKPFSASVALVAMLGAAGTLAQAMVVAKEPPPPPPRGAGQADSRAPRVGMVWAPGYYAVVSRQVFVVSRQVFLGAGQGG